MRTLITGMALVVVSGCATNRDHARVNVVVFRHHPGLIWDRDEADRAGADVEVVFAAMRTQGIPIDYAGGLGQGYFLSIPRRDIRKWKKMLSRLIEEGKLRYYTGTSPDKNQCGFLPAD